jgi:hypothetical protein
VSLIQSFPSPRNPACDLVRQVEEHLVAGDADVGAADQEVRWLEPRRGEASLLPFAPF